MQVLTWVIRARRSTHLNLDDLVIVGRSSLKPREPKSLSNFSVALASCSPGCRQVWEA